MIDVAKIQGISASTLPRGPGTLSFSLPSPALFSGRLRISLSTSVMTCPAAWPTAHVSRYVVRNSGFSFSLARSPFR